MIGVSKCSPPASLYASLTHLYYYSGTGGNVPNVLHQVSVPIMNNTKCQELFTASGHVKRVRVSFLCAGYDDGKKDSCEVGVDSTSPFRGRCLEHFSQFDLFFFLG